MPMLPIRKPFGAGMGMAASAAGQPAAPGMSAVAPQIGRANAMPPMMGGGANGQPQAPQGNGQPIVPPPPVPTPTSAVPGGPMAPGNISSMLTPAQPPPGPMGGAGGVQPRPVSTPLPPWGEDQYGDGSPLVSPADTAQVAPMGGGTGTGVGTQPGTPPPPPGTNVGTIDKSTNQLPMVMLKLMQHLGQV